MTFNSFEFFCFFVGIFLIYYLIPFKFRWILLLAGSYGFYMAWEPVYILLILFSTVVDYFVSHQIVSSESESKKKRLLITSLVVNLGFLFVFKYFNFFNDSISGFLSILNIEYNPIVSNLLLPVGISFYTFQTLSYTIDVYRGTLLPERNFGKFALYVSFFPQLVAGPIERATNLLPQLRGNKAKINYTDFATGLTQAFFGLFKKVVVADSASIYVDSIFNNYEHHTGVTLLLATYLFAFQIYCDFSGYSDMAIGVARMLGFRLMENFKMPYFSKNVTEFWRRWHISLSSWLRDYLYISLGGNRLGNLLTYRNLMITMLLGGLWHGASWNYVIWGALNGIYLAIERYYNYPKKSFFNKNIFSKGLTSFITFNLICLTWIFFRATSFDQSMHIVNEIFFSSDFWYLNIQDLNVFSNIAIGIGVLLCLDYFIFRKQTVEGLINNASVYKVISLNSFFLIMVVLFGVSEGSQFIYFQF